MEKLGRKRRWIIRYVSCAAVVFLGLSTTTAAAFPGASSGDYADTKWVYSEGIASMLKAVDGVYVVNMDRSRDRLDRITWQLDQLGAGSAWKRVSAVDGSLLSTTVNAAAGTKTYHYGGLSVTTWDVETLEAQEGANGGRVAVTLSHLKAICTAYRDGRSWALVMEDDVNLTHDDELGAADVAVVLEALPEDFTIIQLEATITERSIMQRMKDLYDRGYLARSRDFCNSDWVLWGTVAYVISRKGMIHLLRKYWPEALLNYGGDDDADDGYDVCSGGSGPFWPAALRGSFDFTGVTNFVTDYWLYRMKGAFVMNRPAILPPNDYAPTYSQEDANILLVEHSRNLFKRIFRMTRTKGQDGQPHLSDDGTKGKRTSNDIIYVTDRSSQRRVHYTGQGFNVTQSSVTLGTDGVCAAYFGQEVKRNDPRCAYLTASLWDFMAMCGDEAIDNYCERSEAEVAAAAKRPLQGALQQEQQLQREQQPQQLQHASDPRPLDICLMMPGYYQLIEVCESSGGPEQYCQNVLHADTCEVLKVLWPSILVKGKAEAQLPGVSAA